MDVPMMACENLPDTLVPASEGPAWRNCGILTSHREKSIWAVDVDTGELQWVHPDDGKNNERNKGKGTPAFLQREEYTVAAMDAQGRRRVLRFATGYARWPPGGMNFTIARDGNAANLPTVATCSLLMRLPSYPSREVLAKKLHWAIEEQGFHLA